MVESSDPDPAATGGSGGPGNGQQDIRLSDTGRVEAFSDGIFAIVITLLVLDLRLPDYAHGELFHALLERWPAYLAFVVSFVYVGVIWLNHHALFRRIRRMDFGLQWINLCVLFGAVIMPFPTAVLSDALAEGGRHDEQVAVVFYALVAAVMSAPWWLAFSYLRSRPYLLETGVDPAYPDTQRARPITGIGLYAVSALAGWFVPPLGLALIVVMIAYHAFTSEGLREGQFGRVLTARRGR